MLITALLCPSIGDPIYGLIHCPEGQAFGVSCSFTCNPGYDMIGVDTVQCLSNQQWNNTLPFCTPKTCPPLTPNNTVVVEPCYDTLNYTCKSYCEDGYYVEDDHVGIFEQTCLLSEDGINVKWSEAPMCQGNYKNACSTCT